VRTEFDLDSHILNHRFFLGILFARHQCFVGGQHWLAADRWRNLAQTWTVGMHGCGVSTCGATWVAILVARAINRLAGLGSPGPPES
jgi:hypothetical protein